MTTRRELILMALGLGCSVVALPAVVQLKNGSLARGALDPECVKIFVHWTENEHTDPIAYLNSHINLNNPSGVSDRIRQDFAQDNIYMYEGLVASKTEIALLASLGKEVALS